MKAKAYLSEIRTEYGKLREMREKIRGEKCADKRRELREGLRTAASYYTDVLREIWGIIEETEPGTGQEILLRRYVYLEPWEQIAGELGYSLNTVYRYHSKAMARVQKILTGCGRTAEGSQWLQTPVGGEVNRNKQSPQCGAAPIEDAGGAA